MNFFSSDIHFSDDVTLKSDLRPFKNIKQYDKYIIRTWNKQAGKNDTIYVLGDFVDCDGEGYTSWMQSIHYVKKFKAKVVLIIGNNEERIIKYFFDNNFNKFKNFCLEAGFSEVYKNLTITMRNQKIHLIHKPTDYKKNMINLFGHIHMAGGLFADFGINVGVDLNHFRLFSEDDIFHYLDKKMKYWDKSKHIYITRHSQ